MKRFLQTVALGAGLAGASACSEISADYKFDAAVDADLREDMSSDAGPNDLLPVIELADKTYDEITVALEPLPEPGAFTAEEMCGFITQLVETNIEDTELTQRDGPTMVTRTERVAMVGSEAGNEFTQHLIQCRRQFEYGHEADMSEFMDAKVISPLWGDSESDFADFRSIEAPFATPDLVHFSLQNENETDTSISWGQEYGKVRMPGFQEAYDQALTNIRTGLENHQLRKATEREVVMLKPDNNE